MFKKVIKLFSKFGVILLFSLLGQINGFAQSVNEKIDISAEFKKIDEYNQYIQTANTYHYEAKKRTWNDVALFLAGLSGAVGSAVLFNNSNQDIKDYGAPALAGVSFALLWMALESNGTHPRKEDAFKNAQALFKNIPNKK